MSSSLHVENTKKYIIVLDEGMTQGLDHTATAAEAKYPINCTGSEKKYVLTLHYYGNSSFLLVNAGKMHQFKAKD